MSGFFAGKFIYDQASDPTHPLHGWVVWSHSRVLDFGIAFQAAYGLGLRPFVTNYRLILGRGDHVFAVILVLPIVAWVVLVQLAMCMGWVI